MRALLDGSKTQTRRVVKNQPAADVAPIRLSRYHPTVIDRRGEEQPGAEIFGAYSDDGEWGSKCPYGEPGDRLWVRESFRFTSDFDADSPARVGERCLDAGYKTAWAPIQFDADGAQRDWGWVGTPPGREVTAGRIRASMHMPRWASRITLEVTGVRVERLQDIRETDAIAEGIGKTPSGFWKTYGRSGVDGTYSPRSSFHCLWDSINGPESWDANPWVWVVEFKRVS
ncbi:hypothetical protein [Paraburkholderia tuberum]|uniref:hypothetical protein n=1 Tax=Paraburkholderia tuberum TaxID=157910 RepID=UPI001FC8BFBC|nr:hypothetical protein [Paraburkholderia tuberum]